MQSAKGEIIQEFLLNSPPGQVSDVYNGSIGLTKDIRGIVDDKEEIAHLVPAFEAHNKEQLIPIKLPDADYEVYILIVAPEAHIGESLVYDPRSSSTYTVDHMRQTATKADADAPTFDEKLTKLRNAIDEAVAEYVSNYYPSGISSVFVSEDNIVIHIVGNKAGRLRSSWRLSKSNLKGSIKAQIHYYEDGNVQLNSHKESDIDLPSVVDPSEIVKQIQKVEAKFQIAINNAFADSAVATFKALRKALPITKTKIEWQAILAYKVGDDLANK
ncbi:hypothetical protein HDV04_005104 [Boothiomyces sp. JEL0838]|nr:hypothetical protein HDV04_005104 [Boothiomyces sp. JEL0838]